MEHIDLFYNTQTKKLICHLDMYCIIVINYCSFCLLEWILGFSVKHFNSHRMFSLDNILHCIHFL